MSTLSYLGNVNIAVRIVEEQYPQAVLYEVDGATSDGSLTTDPKQITRLRGVFRYGGSTIFIYSKEAWGEWEEPQKIDHPWLDDRIIPWPIDFELLDAYQKMTEAGYTQPFGTITLRWPLYPGEDEPSYIFGLGDGTFVFVGCYTHRVRKATSQTSRQSDI